VNVQTTSRDWRSALLPALILTAIAAYGGVLIGARPDTRDLVSATRGGSPSPGQWTGADCDGSSGDSIDDDAGNPDAPGGLLPASAGLAADCGLMLLSDHFESDPLSLKMDAHLLRGPPYAAHRGQPDDSDNDPAWAGDSNGDSGDSLDDNDDDDDGDDAPGQAVAPVPTTLTADHGQVELFICHQVDRRVAFVSDGHSLRAPPQ
jgi:hypothetical protein